MSSWARQGGTGAQGRVASLLNKIPGYSGYKNKESRRDEDKRVREELAREYGQFAQRLADLQGELARARRFAEIGNVERVERALRRFTDRLRTATYGYGGLMGDRDVDSAALDQLRQFDEGLLSGVDELAKPIADLEAALAANGDLAAPARAGTAVVRNLLARFDLRAEVVETGKPAPAESVLRVLQPPRTDETPPTFNLHDGDALAILGDDYLVDSRIEVAGEPWSFRLFRLSGGTEEQWLFAPNRAEPGLALLRPVAEPPAPGVETAIDGTAYTPQSAGSGDGEVIGVGGRSGLRPVRFAILAGSGDPQARAVVLDWGTERQAFAGREVHPNDVEIFGRPSPRLN